MKYFILLLAVLSVSIAKPLDINATLPTITLNDQFEQSHTVPLSIGKIIFSEDKSSSTLVNGFIKKQPQSGTYLATKNAVFISNITKMPSFITRMFAIPKMKKYQHKVLLIDDDNNDMFHTQDDHIAIFTINGGIITDIVYVKNINDLQSALGE